MDLDILATLSIHHLATYAPKLTIIVNSVELIVFFWARGAIQ